MIGRALILLAVIGAGFSPAAAQSIGYEQPVRICPASPEDAAPPDFAAPDCRTVSFADVDPQGRLLWMRAVVEIEEDLLERAGPLGLFVSGKAASEAWINGARIGANGAPAADAASETPGRMDAVIYLPHELIAAGENEIALRLSAHHGFLRFSYPMHQVGIGPYGDPTRAILRSYWPSLVTLGVFALGFVSFGVAAVRGEDREGSALLSLLSALAAGQLAVESARGLVAYAYPIHEIRVIGIAVFAYCFGLCLLALVAQKTVAFDRARRSALVGVTAAACLLAVLLARGFDLKAALGLLIPVLPAIGLAAIGAWRGRPEARVYLAALIAFAALFFVSGGEFLDRYFYFAVAALLLVLFAMQAASLVRERRARRDEQLRARQLELALDQVRERAAPSELTVAGAGRMERVSTAHLTHLKAAGDYVELHLDDGRTVLHADSLAALEDALPATFVRVHRSWIVNTAFVRALDRDASGTGVLTLTDGTEIPVSRRVMPRVRGVMAGAGA